MVTVDILKNEVSYNPETGDFIRLKFKVPMDKSRIGKSAVVINNCGYATIAINGKNRLAHRMAWLYVYGELPKKDIDHINRNKTDNRICNLRLANDFQNGMNVGLKKTNISGNKCVWFLKSVNRWETRCTVNGKRIYIGKFKEKSEAVNAYNEFTKVHHKEFFVAS